MKAFVLAVAVLLTAHTFVVGLLQFPICCVRQSYCPINRHMERGTPSCDHDDVTGMLSRTDGSIPCFQNCDSMKRLTTLIDPAVLTANPEVPFTLVKEAVHVEFSALVVKADSDAPEPPPRHPSS